jgi:hypothetical protein
MPITDICLCGHGIERHTPTYDYGHGDFCHGRPEPGPSFGDRAIGPKGPCACRAFRFRASSGAPTPQPRAE